MPSLEFLTGQFKEQQLMKEVRIYCKAYGITLVDREDFLPCLYDETDLHRIVEVIEFGKIFVASAFFSKGLFDLPNKCVHVTRAVQSVAYN